MEKRDLASGGFCSDSTRKKLKLDVSVAHEEEEVVGDNLSSLADKEKESINALVKSFIRSGINPNTINTPSFAKFIRLLNPDFSPSVSALEKEALEIHEECKEKAKEFLKSFQGKLTLSYEWMVLGHGWTSYSLKGPVLHEGFVCVTAHFVDDDWKFRKWILGYTTNDGDEEGKEIALRNAFEGFEIEGKVSALLLPNEVGFGRGLEERGDNNVFLVYCCADLFRLMVDDVFNELSESLLEDVRMLVGWGKCSFANWNVWLSHLQQAVDMKLEDAFSKDEVYVNYDKPSDEEWIKIQTFSRLVGCIYRVAVELFEGGYSTSNVYFYLLAELKVMLEKEVESADSDYFRSKAERMLKRFDKYWERMFLVLAAASVLDPRFKMKYVEFYCSKNQGCDEGSNAETVLDYLRSLFARYAASELCQKPICPVATVDSKEQDENDNDGGGEDCGEEEEGEEEDYDEEQKEGEKVYDTDSSEEAEREARKMREEKPDACKDFVLFQEFLKFEGSSPRELGETELDAYLNEPVMEWNNDFRALDWWREEGGHKYPVLSRVARDILSIPISRATSYDAYVSGKREPPAFVVSLEAKVANAMMCSKKWLRL